MSTLRLVESINAYENNLGKEIVAKADVGIYYTCVWKWKEEKQHKKVRSIVTTLSIVCSYDKDKLIEYVKKPKERTIIRFSYNISNRSGPLIYNSKNTYPEFDSTYWWDCCNCTILICPNKSPDDEAKFHRAMEELRENDVYEEMVDKYYDDYFQMDMINIIMANFEALLEH